MNLLQISPDLLLPLDVVTYTIAVLGIRGTGKTNTATVLVEEALKLGQRSIVIDPLDVWWGIKSSADGTKPGFPVVVFGGEHADLPLEESDGERLATLLVSNQVTAILSIAHLRKGAQVRFVASFCETLYQLKAASRERTMIVIDEASSFVPQSFQGESARCVGAIEDLVRRGRSRGIGVVLIDQRAASVNKNVLTQLELLIAHRQTSPQDRKAIKDWVEASDDSEKTKELVGSIASIGTGDAKGEAWVWSPLLNIFSRVQIRLRTTFDSSRTPGPGESPATPSTVATIDLDALREALDAGKKEPEHNPKERIQRVVELENRVLELETQLMDETRKCDRLELVIAEFGVIAQRLVHLCGSVEGDLPSMLAVIEQDDRNQSQTPKIVQQIADGFTETVGAEFNPIPAQRRILQALSDFRALGTSELSRSNLAVMSDQSAKSSSYATNLRVLVEHGLISKHGESYRITGLGVGYVPPSSTPPTLAALHKAWCSKLKPKAAAILMLLIDADGGELSAQAIAKKTGQSITSSSFSGHLRDLREYGLIRKTTANEWAATDQLFPRGLK